jgi:hypothetical protein
LLPAGDTLGRLDAEQRFVEHSSGHVGAGWDVEQGEYSRRDIENVSVLQPLCVLCGESF